MTPPPRLTWWSHVWRYALVLTISAASWFEVAQWQWDHQRWWFWVDLALGLVGLLLLPQRHRLPAGVAAVTNALTFVSWSSTGPATLALVSMATRRRWREIIPIGILALTAGVVLETANPVGTDSFAFTVPFIVSIIGVTVGWGMYIGSRRELLAALRERAEIAEAEQSSRLAQARSAERARIAREMHDVLAHRISLVAMHAGALTYSEDLDADEVRATAAVIQESSRQALVELRQVLGVLRDRPEDSAAASPMAPEAPQPSADDLPDLIIEARRSGMRIETERGIELDGMPEMLGRTLYRIVQEGLTNARKHAPDTRVVVNLDGGPIEGLTVEVRNPLRVGSPDARQPVSGFGLIGLAERTELAGGRLSHQISAEREFVLEAWLPWPA